MTLLWPPRALGLGTPLNLAALSAETRPVLRRDLSLFPLYGSATALLVFGTDWLLFGGRTAESLPGFDEHPPVLSRLWVSVFGSIAEEAMFRLFLVTLVACVAYLILARVMSSPRVTAQWIGTFAAAGAACIYHFGAPDVLRVITVNVIAAVVYGWLYWNRGLETAILTHFVMYLCLYLGVPALR